MFSVARHVRPAAIVPPGLLRPPLHQCRRCASSKSKKTAAASDTSTEEPPHLYIPHTPLAQQLLDTGLYDRKYKKPNSFRNRLIKVVEKPGTKGTKPATKRAVKGDGSRINIVDEKLCDDVISYMGPTLERHRGCDIIDLYPGAGIFSRKLNDFLQPRSHILMEPDIELYKPFLEPLTSREGTVVVPKSGFIWKNLTDVLCPQMLPHQKEVSPSAPPERNDTLLLVANLAFHPKKKVGIFDSIGTLLLYQFINSISSSSLFQKYGLVRMLVWAGESDKIKLLPRIVQRRRRMAIDGELTTEWIAEVCSPEVEDADDLSDGQHYMRDINLELSSTRRALDRMRAAGLKIPPGREGVLMRRVLDMEANGVEVPEPGTIAPYQARSFHTELKQLQVLKESGRITMTPLAEKRLKNLRTRVAWDHRRAVKIQALLLERDAIAQLRTAARAAQSARAAGGSQEVTEEQQKKLDQEAEALDARERAWEAEIEQLDTLFQQAFFLARDNLRIFKQDPPVLSWDRRPLDPMACRATEFMPNVPCSLLDIQPKATHPLLREQGPESASRAGDIHRLLQSALLRSAVFEPVTEVLQSIWHGAADGVLPNCPSLWDASKGGSPLGVPLESQRFDGIAPRSMNQEQWAEMLEAWSKWPFRPDYTTFAVADSSAEEPEDSDPLK